ncbi:unnamed protein product [Rotaria magnacalcarata]|uniref:Serpin domain-containing protein n=3 Tax=Rotaria magnacalcarata TaxID=392030 RepID=A0A818Y2J2_9BILA|nr:unnamed protein product [Rotaria magnacalcarata]CAF2078222.1 unnamed protein product [Rotaria magnacalcarata]CAF3748649.1 unnamed protein product [Rotaria magnacalcarata]CAF4023192.1 unnamed protein product [Rotaria magnacalcarata]
MAVASTESFAHFGSKLFATITRENNFQNVFLSPASIALAMSMCTAGARHETLKQMLKVFEVSSIKDLENSANHVMQVFSNNREKKSSTIQSATDLLPSASDLPKVPNPSSVTLRLVNCLYVQKGFTIRDDYLDLLKHSFHSAIDLEDFENNSAEVVEKINVWVEKQTRKRIRDLLSTDEVTKDTRLILVNCIYFKGEWVDRFQQNSTDKNADFHGIDGTTSKIELMFQKTNFNYAENKDLQIQIAHLPYKNMDSSGVFIFTIVLPHEGVNLNEIEGKLMSNTKLMHDVLSFDNANSIELSLYLPKFKMETKYELGDMMISLGMKDAFDEKKANFKGIIGTIKDENRIAITKVIHRTFLNVDEEGTEAAGAGAVIMGRFGCRFRDTEKPIEFKANRPFLFFIQEVRQNVILFSGKFVSPPTPSR